MMFCAAGLHALLVERLWVLLLECAKKPVLRVSDKNDEF